MKKLWKSIFALLMVLALLPVLTGCSGSGKSEFARGEESYSASYSTSNSTGSYYEYGDYYAEEAYEMEAPAMAEDGYYGGTATTEMKSESLGTDPSDNPALMDAKLIYRAYINMETLDFDTAVGVIKDRIEKAGGYIENSSLSYYGSYRYVSYVLRVPSNQYRYFCDTAGEIGNIRSFNESVENISESYYDTESRLASARTKLEALQELMKQAVDMEDLITIQNAISDVQYEIDYLSGNLRRYDSLVAFSTIQLDLTEVSRLTGTEEPPVGFGQELAQAFRRGAKNFVEGLENTLIGFARHFVGWLIFIAIVVIIIFVTKSLVKKSKAKKQQQMQQYMAQRAMNASAMQGAPVNAAPAKEENSNAPAENPGPASHQ